MMPLLSQLLTQANLHPSLHSQSDGTLHWVQICVAQPTRCRIWQIGIVKHFFIITRLYLIQSCSIRIRFIWSIQQYLLELKGPLLQFQLPGCQLQHLPMILGLSCNGVVEIWKVIILDRHRYHCHNLVYGLHLLFCTLEALLNLVHIVWMKAEGSGFPDSCCMNLSITKLIASTCFMLLSCEPDHSCRCSHKGVWFTITN